MAKEEPKSIPEMLADSCREAGMLVGVFGLLDGLWHEELRPATCSVTDPPTPGSWYVKVFGIALALWGLGVIIERMRASTDRSKAGAAAEQASSPGDAKVPGMSTKVDEKEQ